MKRAGTRRATWSVTYSDSRCVSTYGSLAAALADVAYFAAEGRDATPTITRTELCLCGTYDGAVPVRGARGMYRDVPCKGHVAPVEILETLDAGS